MPNDCVGCRESLNQTFGGSSAGENRAGVYWAIGQGPNSSFRSRSRIKEGKKKWFEGEGEGKYGSCRE